MPENKIDVDKLKAECSSELDEFYKHTHPAIAELRSLVCKILHGGNYGK
jgi:hypothetical protein